MNARNEAAKTSELLKETIKKKVYTTEDIDALPEKKRAEIIDGELYMMAAPSLTHQRLLFSVSRKIADYIDRNNGNCEVLPAPFAVFLNDDHKNYLEPGITIVCDPDKLDEKGCHGAPDWIIEIVSQGNKPMDYFTKLFKYRSAGVREYWIVDPAKERVMVYRFEAKLMEEYSFGEDIPAGIFEGFSIYID
ncbi:MAG: Uma2 family endonuclease [Eubacterium sp.]|nr:Uma2 family endonuclease [Eubacterium sp.]